MTVRTYQPGPDVLPAGGAAPVSTPQGWEAHPQGAARPKTLLPVRRQTAYPASTPAASSSSPGYQRRLLRKARTPVRPNEAAEQPFAVAAPTVTALPEGWQSEPAPRQRAPRTLARDEQTLLKTPPLAPAFPEGWQAQNILPGKPNRTLALDVPLHLRFVVAALSFPDGWQAARAIVPILPVVRRRQQAPAIQTTPVASSSAPGYARRLFRRPLPVRRYDDHFLAPVAAPPASSPQGWDAARAVQIPLPWLEVGGDLTAVAELPPYPEGWQVSDRKPGRPTRTLTFDVPLLFRFVPVPTSFPDGWQALEARRRLLPPRNYDGSAGILFPVARAVPQGWQVERGLSFLLRRRQPVESELILPAVPLPFLPGWQAERCRLYALAHSLAHDEQVILRVPPLAPPFPEGWQPQEAWNRSLWKFLRPAVLSAFYDVLFPSTKAFRVISLQGNYLPSHALSGTNLPSKNLAGTNIPSKNLSGN